MALLIGMHVALSQEKDIDQNDQQWIQYYGSLDLSDQWILSLDGGYRVKNKFRDKSQFISRMAIAYRLSAFAKLGGGFAFLGFYEDKEISRLEYRPYQELEMVRTIGKIDLSHKFRLEERFFVAKNPENSSEKNSFNFRFRYQIQVLIPVYKFNKNKEISLLIANEVFLNAGKEISHNIFDQNRLMVGPGFQFFSNLSAYLIYNYQFASTPTANRYLASDILWLKIYHNFTLE